MDVVLSSESEEKIFKRYIDENGVEVIQVDRTGTYHRKTVCYPPHWGGIVPGITQEKDLLTLYGKGLYNPNLPHLGVRYYTDPRGKITVAVSIGVDQIIDSVTVTTGRHAPSGFSAEDPNFVSKRVDPKEGFAWGHLHLGSTRDQVHLYLGDPASQDHKANTWTYYTDYKDTNCFLVSEVTFVFSNDTVKSVMLYNGE